MPSERRFSEEEIAAIFEQAATAQRAALDRPDGRGGLSLAELQAIGADAGLSADAIAHAAASFEADTHNIPLQKFFGLPLNASHTIDIPGSFSDKDWDRLVVDLRHTFQAAGEIRLDGSLREWRNGNLYALIEPTESGARLRMGSSKRESLIAVLGGAGWFVFMFMVGLMKFAQLGYELDPKIMFVGLLALAGLGVAGFSAARLPRWSKERQQQMQAIAGRVVSTRRSRATEAKDKTLEADIIEGDVAQRQTVIDIPEESDFSGEDSRGRNRVKG